MKRIPTQTELPFGRRQKVLNRQIRQRANDERVTRGPGRPRKRRAHKTDARVAHVVRTDLTKNSAAHVTVRVVNRVPNLRTRRRFNVIKNAFIKFCGRGATSATDGFRLVHFAVLSNHLHFIVEADSKKALSMGMQKLLHSISRRLNALNVEEAGGKVSTKGGSYRNLRGWLGRIFVDRYHAHILRAPKEMKNAVHYVLTNAQHHYGTSASGHKKLDSFTSIGLALELRQTPHIAMPRGSPLARACTQTCRLLT